MPSKRSSASRALILILLGKAFVFELHHRSPCPSTLARIVVGKTLTRRLIKPLLLVSGFWLLSAPQPHPHLLVTKMASCTLSFDQTQYKEKSRKLVTLVNQLRDVGAQASFTVPTLVVCGNQSAGKSSLLERLCAVKLPRAVGTCTKCPAEVQEISPCRCSPFK